jgi:peptidoglycan/xylan/chitin deacetylase (PgdA/CDA1 family)
VLIGIVLLVGLSWLFIFRDYLAAQRITQYRPTQEYQTKQYNSISYDAEKEIGAATAKMQLTKSLATVVTGVAGKEKRIALTFDGRGSQLVMDKILESLQKHQVQATFFIEGMQVAEDPQLIQKIKQAGFAVGNYSLHGLPQMEELAVDKLVFDFCQSKKIFLLATDTESKTLKCNETNYTEPLRHAASACGFLQVVKSDVVVTAQTIKVLDSVQAANDYVNKIKPGSIVSVKLKPRKESQTGAKLLPQPLDKSEDDLVLAVDRLLSAMKKNGWQIVALTTLAEKKTSRINAPGAAGFLSEFAVNIEIALRKLLFATAYAAGNDETKLGDPAKEIRIINTTEQALSVSFSDILNEAAVQAVLARLKLKATFFVSEKEMRTATQTIKAILAEGHELGLAINPRAGSSAEQTRKAIVSGRAYLKEKYSVATELVKQTYGAVEANTLLAVRDENVYLIGHTLTMVQAKHKDANSAEQVFGELFPPKMKALARGQIAHFRLDFYSNKNLAADMIEELKRQKVDNIAFATDYDNPRINSANDSTYKIKPIGEILGNKKYRYQFPVDPKNILPQLQNVKSGCHGEQRSFLEKVYNCYIGNSDVNENDRLLNFSRMEIRRIDRVGTIHTTDPVIFLTFDDWGSDEPVNKLLYVLRKHKAPATFFVLTHTVLKNANLLRAIAAEGHDIADHTDRHVAMVKRDLLTGKQSGFQYSKEEYRDELKESFQKLLMVVGDVEREKRPVITKYFRPPQLAVTRAGMEAVYEAGYDYIVSGSFSTEDYAAADTASLVKTILGGIYSNNSKTELVKGSVLVMHITDNSIYTALAVDILLTANAKKADDDPTKFTVGRLSDYLNDSYTQKSRKKAY